VWGMAIGIPLSVLVVVAALLVWARYWAPLKSAESLAKRENPYAAIVAARLPRLAGDAAGNTWPGPLDPIPASPFVVIIADSQGVRLISGRDETEPILALGWDDVVRIAAVEYVEHGRAYDGIGIFGPTRAVAVQPVRPSAVGVAIPKRDGFEVLIAELMARRPDGFIE